MAKRTNKHNTKRTALLGILTAIILIQTFVPFFGNIPLGPLNLTIIHITVIVATLAISTMDGIIIGSIWGITRWIKALTIPSSILDPILWINPAITIIPRVLIGLTTGITFKLLSRRGKEAQKSSMVVASVVGSLTNTLLVLLLIYFFSFYSEGFAANLAAGIEADTSNLAGAISVLIGVNGVAEAVAAGIAGPLIARPLMKINRTKMDK